MAFLTVTNKRTIPVSIAIIYLAISIFTFLFLIRSFLIVCKAWHTTDFLTATKEKNLSLRSTRYFLFSPSLFLRKPTISTLFTLSLPAPINNVLHTAQNYVNPTGLKNTLAGQLVALTLAVRFDGLDPNFGAAGINLGDMEIGQHEGTNTSV